MRPSTGWTSGCLRGLVAVVLTTFAAWFIPFIALALVALGFVGVRRMALSGYLVGFGVLWLALMAFQFVSGGHLDNSLAWAMVDAVPLVVGVALGMWASEA